MMPNLPRIPLKRSLLAVALALAMPLHSAAAQERESLEQLRATTLNLINALVEAGVITRQKADELLRQAAVPPRTAAAAPAPQQPAAEGAASGVVRVPYVPQVVRDQIRDEVKEEVLAQAKAERWGVPNALPDWTDRIRLEADVRVRYQQDDYGSDNPTPDQFVLASLSGVTRAADLAAASSNFLPLANTQDDRDRMRVRARFGITGKISNELSAGVRVTTGNANDRVSTSQTLGNDFNKWSIYMDQAYLRYEPYEWVDFVAGRFANPFFHTEMIWADSLNFEGAAITFKLPVQPWTTFEPFATIGWFPIRADNPPDSSRTLTGAQIGFQWTPSETMRFKVGVAQYDYSHMAGQIDTDYDPVFGPGRTYGQYEYGPGLRQKGNTLFLTNSPVQIQQGITPPEFLWGLASKFKPLSITAAAEFAQLSPVVVRLSGEWVKNQDYDTGEIYERTGVLLTDGGDTGWYVRTIVGASDIRKFGDWQFIVGYRSIGSDAVIDGFNDSDFGLGGTNVKGYWLGGLFGLARNSWAGLRYFSSKSLASPTVTPALNDSFSVNTLMVELYGQF